MKKRLHYEHLNADADEIKWKAKDEKASSMRTKITSHSNSAFCQPKCSTKQKRERVNLNKSIYQMFIYIISNIE